MPIEKIGKEIERIRVPMESGTDYQIIVSLINSMKNNSLFGLSLFFILFSFVIKGDFMYIFDNRGKIIDIFGFKVPPLYVLFILFIFFTIIGSSFLESLSKLGKLITGMPKEQKEGAIRILEYYTFIFNPFSINTKCYELLFVLIASNLFVVVVSVIHFTVFFKSYEYSFFFLVIGFILILMFIIFHYILAKKIRIIVNDVYKHLDNYGIKFERKPVDNIFLFCFVFTVLVMIFAAINLSMLYP